MIRLLLALFAGFFASTAFAQWLPGHDYVLDRAGNVIYVRGPSITTPSYVVTGSNTGAIVRSTKDLIVDNRKVAIQAAKTIPWKNVATGLKVVARTNPYAMAAGFAVDWLIDNNWKVVPCINNASMCDGLAQWQKKQTNTGGDITKDYQAATVPNAPWRGALSTVVESDIKPYAQSQINPSPGTPADQIPKLRDWRCSSSSCSSVQIDQRSDRDIAYGLPKWDPGSYSTWPLNERQKQIETNTESWVNSPPPDFDKEPPSAPDPGKAPDIWDDALPGGIPDSDGGPSVSGPASVPGPSSTTTNSDGSTVTTNTVNNFTYNNNNSTVTVTTTTTTTTTDPNGSTSSQQTTEDGKPEPEESVAPPRDPDMPEVPTLYEKKYPDGLSGVWATRKAQLQTTPIFSFLASLVPSTGDGGCPSWQLPVMYGIKNTSVVDISIPCWIWSAIRAIFVVTALLSCRRIIFGG